MKEMGKTTSWAIWREDCKIARSTGSHNRDGRIAYISFRTTLNAPGMFHPHARAQFRHERKTRTCNMSHL